MQCTNPANKIKIEIYFKTTLIAIISKQFIQKYFAAVWIANALHWILNTRTKIYVYKLNFSIKWVKKCTVARCDQYAHLYKFQTLFYSFMAFFVFNNVCFSLILLLPLSHSGSLSHTHYFYSLLQEWNTAEHGTMAHHSHFTNGPFGSYESKYFNNDCNCLIMVAVVYVNRNIYINLTGYINLQCFYQLFVFNTNAEAVWLFPNVFFE